MKWIILWLSQAHFFTSSIADLHIFLCTFFSDPLIYFHPPKFGSTFLRKLKIKPLLFLRGPRLRSRYSESLRATQSEDRNPGRGGARFFAPSLLYNGYRPWGKAAGVSRWPPTPFSAQVKEKVQVYLYIPSGPSWTVLWWILLFLFVRAFNEMKTFAVF